MLNANVVRLSGVLLFVASVPPQSLGASRTNVYEITSGVYTECCGIAGTLEYALPYAGQRFVRLVVDEAETRARMIILSEDLREFRTYENGRVFPDYIEFGFPDPSADVEHLHYIVSNSAAGIRFDGIEIRPQIGADIPNHFTHTNVVAAIRPDPPPISIRVSEVEVCWSGASNQTYRVQYRSSLTGNAWINLGPPVIGNDRTNCIADKILPDQEQRFYRVVPGR